MKKINIWLTKINKAIYKVIFFMTQKYKLEMTNKRSNIKITKKNNQQLSHLELQQNHNINNLNM